MTMSPDRLSRNLLVSALVIVALALASLTPVAAGSALGATAARRLINNLLHIPAYGLLTWLLNVALSEWKSPSVGGWALPASCGIALAFGALLELAQCFVPGRSCTLGDFLLNGAGAAAATCILWLAKSTA